ncbi:hypothetical protein HJC99_05820 [Candidatus Saccharibacteria bacterium]|nr:hypothetical protein [Candidatus Saccharibacteria bacterium]
MRPGEEPKLIIVLPSDIEAIEPMVSHVLAQAGGIVAVDIGAYDTLGVPKALCRFETPQIAVQGRINPTATSLLGNTWIVDTNIA